jgi:hypothetical protein
VLFNVIVMKWVYSHICHSPFCCLSSLDYRSGLHRVRSWPCHHRR